MSSVRAGTTALDLTHKRIAVVAHVLKYGQAQDLIKFLHEQETENVLFVAHPLTYVQGRPGPEMRLFEGGAQIRSRRLKNRKLPAPLQYLLDTILTILWVIRSGGVWDVIIAFDNLNGLAALILRRLGRARRIVFFTIDYVPRRFPNRLLNELYHRLDRFCLRHADATWNVSDRIAEGRLAVRGLRPQDFPRQLTVPIGIWFDRFPRLPFDAIEENSIVYSGGLLPHQGVQLVVAALPRIVAEIPDVRFYITGIGPMEDELRGLVAELRLHQHVRFLGYLESHEDLESLLARCSLAVAMYSAELDVWSRYADPSKIKSYLAAGLAVITTDVTHIAQDISRRQCGLVLPYEVEAFAEGVTALLGDPARLQAMRENAVRFAREFDWPTVWSRALSDPRLGLE